MGTQRGAEEREATNTQLSQSILLLLLLTLEIPQIFFLALQEALLLAKQGTEKRQGREVPLSLAEFMSSREEHSLFFLFGSKTLLLPPNVLSYFLFFAFALGNCRALGKPEEGSDHS